MLEIILSMTLVQRQKYSLITPQSPLPTFLHSRRQIIYYIDSAMQQCSNAAVQQCKAADLNWHCCYKVIFNYKSHFPLSVAFSDIEDEKKKLVEISFVVVSSKIHFKLFSCFLERKNFDEIFSNLSSFSKTIFFKTKTNQIVPGIFFR